MLPLRPFKTIAREAGVRLSASAAVEIARDVSEWADEIARKAVRLAGHAGRKTVMGEDVQFALSK